MGGRAFHFVDEAEDVRDGELPEPTAQRSAAAARTGERLEETIERSVLAEEEQLVLAAEVVIQVAGRQLRGAGDVAHPGGGEADVPERARGGAEDFHAPGIGPALAAD